MTENAATKGAMGVIAGVFGYLVGSFNALLVVLAILMMVDYVTGVTVALKNSEFDTGKGIWGAITKLFYILIVLVGFLADYTIMDTAARAGLDFSTGGLLGIAVTLYLIGNEGLSITENWVVLGLPVPPFLRTAFGYMKDQSGKIVKMPEKESVEQ
ncbi:phage holin family protein [Petroclostridium sp. X23]|uniref:phage holin family protein n=1 Tax=Petroclostridium sp. X23 TaxID=3045146 RepID=UPI0024AD3BE3|nr:phage holin family protein [Petroclostridium sp. X23]WHH58492.1 phage holin family protein [Petroclostridium sp. X23]